MAFVDAPVCVETFSVVWICDPERRADCPEGRTILALDRGAWTIVGRSERLCLEDLVVHMPEPAALRFDAFLWCQRSLDELIGAALLEPGGLGPVRIGMTVAEIEAATRSRLDVPEGDDSVGVGDCRWVGLGSPAEVDLIVRAPAGTPPGDLHRVAVVVSIWGYIGATERGVGLGDPQAEALAAYPDAEVQPNVWSQPNGLWISWPTRDHPQAITFETDGARVTAIHAGRHLPEGCHP